MDNNEILHLHNAQHLILQHIMCPPSPQITPLASNVSRVPYPIPPAGADPATYRSEEEPPPLGFAVPFAPNVVLLSGMQSDGQGMPQVGRAGARYHQHLRSAAYRGRQRHGDRGRTQQCTRMACYQHTHTMPGWGP